MKCLIVVLMTGKNLSFRFASPELALSWLKVVETAMLTATTPGSPRTVSLPKVCCLRADAIAAAYLAERPADEEEEPTRSLFGAIFGDRR